jgi:hypothetical protein
MFHNKVLRNIFESEREVTGGCKKQLNEGLYKCELIKSRTTRQARHVVRPGDLKNMYLEVRAVNDRIS